MPDRPEVLVPEIELAPPEPEEIDLEQIPDLPADTEPCVSIPTASDLDDFQRLRSQSGHLLHLAPDIHVWLLSLGPDWEEKADAILRREMLSQRGL